MLEILTNSQNDQYNTNTNINNEERRKEGKKKKEKKERKEKVNTFNVSHSIPFAESSEEILSLSCLS